MKKINRIVMSSVIGASLLFGCSNSTDTTESTVIEESFVPVETMKPVEGSLDQSIQLTGSVDTQSSVVIYPQISAPEIVDNIVVSVGSEVTKNQVLVNLSGDTLDDQVESARLQYELSKANYASQLESYQNAVDNFEKTKALYEQGAISESDYEQAKIYASDTQLKLIENQLASAKFGYETAVKSKSDLNITSPVDGIVSEINLSENNYASSQSYIRIIDLENLEINLSIPEGKLKDISVGQTVSIEFPAIDKTIESQITTIDPNKNLATNMYNATVKFQNTSLLEIKPGMKVYVNVLKLGKPTYLIPIDAVLTDNDGAFIYTVNEDQTINRVSVESGYENGEVVEILSGVSGNESVIVSGQDFVDPQGKVIVVRGE